MALDIEKKDLLLGQTIDTVVSNADDNFTTLFDTVDDLDDAIKTKLPAAPNGSNSLIKDGKVNTVYLPDSVLGQLEYQGTWNPGSGTNVATNKEKGHYWIAEAAGIFYPDGTRNTDNPFETGDWAVYNGETWDKVDNTDAVTLVNGQKGSVKTYKGAYSAETTYYQGDQVLHDNCLYLYVNASSGKGVGSPSSDTTGTYWRIYGKIYNKATASSDGLMSKEDFSKLSGIAEGANKTTVDAALSDSSTNPVQNKAVKAALDKKVDKVTGKGLSTNDYTTEEKNKLAGIDSTLVGVTASDIGKVKDVKVNGTSVLDTATGVASISIVIEDLESEYTDITTFTTKVINTVTYHGFNVLKTDTAFEVYNADGQMIITQRVVDGDNVFVAVGTSAPTKVTIRKISGGAVSGGSGFSSRLYKHELDITIKQSEQNVAAKFLIVTTSATELYYQLTSATSKFIVVPTDTVVVSARFRLASGSTWQETLLNIDEYGRIMLGDSVCSYYYDASSTASLTSPIAIIGSSTSTTSTDTVTAL